METVSEYLKDLPVNDLILYIELGNNAGKSGNLEESVDWYMKGLSKARELRNSEYIKKLSALVALSL